MYIKNQFFKDEDTLAEVLFDFYLGEPAAPTKKLMQAIEKDLAENTEYNKYLASLNDPDDKKELEEEERSLRLAEKLMEQFTSFEVNSSRLFGIKGDIKTLLYEIDLY